MRDEDVTDEEDAPVEHAVSGAARQVDPVPAAVVEAAKRAFEQRPVTGAAETPAAGEDEETERGSSTTRSGRSSVRS
jgi:hypothetical protein